MLSAKITPAWHTASYPPPLSFDSVRGLTNSLRHQPLFRTNIFLLKHEEDKYAPPRVTLDTT